MREQANRPVGRLVQRERMARWAARFVASALLVLPAAARQEWRSELDAAQAQLVTELEELVDWCTKEKLFVSRDQVCHDILHFDPEHYRAHKSLKHSQDRDGNWSPPKRPPKSKNYKSDLTEHDEKRAAIVQAYRTKCLKLLALDGRSPHTAEEEVLRTVLVLDPRDAEVRALLGEVAEGEDWLLAETIAGRERRGKLRELQLAALKEAATAIGPGEVKAKESALGLAWSNVAASNAVRVVGTGDRKEVEQVAQASHAVGPFFRGVFGRDTRHYADLTIFVMREERERDQFLDSHPAVPPERREEYRRLVGGGFPESPDVAMWNPEPRERLDAATRLVLGSFMRDAFGVSMRNGWVFEGLGMYINRQLIATRLTWYSPGGGSPAAQALRERLIDPSANWMDEARTVLAGNYDLSALLAKETHTMDAQDMVVSYALAAYLVEGRHDTVAAVLDRVGHGAEPSVAVLEDVLGYDVKQLRGRLVRWLDERKGS